MKQVIIIREDLKLSKGKLAVQVAHAAITAAIRSSQEAQAKWMSENQTKIVLKVKTLEELVRIYDNAVQAELPCCLIMDAGYTVVKPGTITVVGIGACEDEVIDNITGGLKLL